MKLATYLSENDITRSAFALEIRTSRQNVSRWCEGVMPRRDDLMKIMAATKGQVTPIDFAFEKPRPVSEQRRAS